MVFGNPDEFALYVDVVDEWCNLYDNLEGLSGIWLKGELLITNIGLISLSNDFENIIEQTPKLIACSMLYKLRDVDLLKELLKARFPNWCASSSLEWEENIDEWQDVEEVNACDLSFESCHTGHEINHYLLGIRGHNGVRLLLYRKNDTNHFFNFEKITDSDIASVEITYAKLELIVSQLESYISNAFKSFRGL